MSFHLILFLAFGAVCVGGAVNLLAQRHPINSALSLIAVMAALAGEYLLLGAEFVAAVQVIVYAGAIMVLFVFVIMLLNAGEEEETKGSRVAILLGVPGMLISSVLMAWVATRFPTELWEKYSTPLLFIGLGLLLLVLIPGIGAVVNGARRWLRIGVLNFQVSELAKVLVLTWLCSYCVRKRAELERLLKSLG